MREITAARFGHPVKFDQLSPDTRESGQFDRRPASGTGGPARTHRAQRLKGEATAERFLHRHASACAKARIVPPIRRGCKRPRDTRLPTLCAARRRSTGPSPTVREIGTDHVTLNKGDSELVLPNDRVLVCAGGDLPTPMLKKIGIEVEAHYGT